MGWVKIGENSADNQTDAPYLVLERQLFGPEGSNDFDRIKVLAWDPARRDYYTVLREDVKGRFPVESTVNGRAGTFAIPAASGKLVYDFAIPAEGKAKAKRREEPKVQR